MVESDAAPSTALLVMDIQPSVVPAFGGDDELLERLQRVIAAARGASIPVIFGRVAFRTGYPDVSDSNALFSWLKSNLDFTEANPDTGFHPAVTPQEGDLLILKRRVSSFTGSDLEVVLRSRGVRRLVITGVATSGVVLSTVRQAADLDYEMVVLSDGCADGDGEVHRLLMEKVFPSQATVSTVDEWIKSLPANP
jgi:nicotinamidase-related amidase